MMPAGTPPEPAGPPPARRRAVAEGSISPFAPPVVYSAGAPQTAASWSRRRSETPSSKDTMAENESPDPWDSLAESLGATPANDAAPAPRPTTTPPRRRTPPAASRPAPPPPAADWDNLAQELGLAEKAQSRPAASRSGQAEERPASSTQRPRREPVRREADEQPAEARRAAPPRDPGPVDETGSRRRREDDLTTRPRAEEGPRDGTAADERTEPRRDDDEDGPPRRRRRRGRRGGRGRRREGGGERTAAASGDEGSSEREDSPAPRRRRAATTLQRPDEDSSEAESWREDVDAGFVEPLAASDDETAAAPEADESSDDRPRRRRRRGRRSGRGRTRAGGDREDRPDRDHSPGEPALNDDHGDEPMPASYGSRPAENAEPAAPRGGSAEGEASRSRSRRRRRSRRDSGEAVRREPAAGRARERRDRRGGESRSSRGRRSDFAPVAGRYEEDDEGLEFLGVEEAARDGEPRPRPPAEEDEVLTESGLTSVLDVPSWVEAIGIVIAGNMDSRKQPPQT